MDDNIEGQGPCRLPWDGHVVVELSLHSSHIISSAKQWSVKGSMIYGGLVRHTMICGYSSKQQLESAVPVYSSQPCLFGSSAVVVVLIGNRSCCSIGNDVQAGSATLFSCCETSSSRRGESRDQVFANEVRPRMHRLAL